MEIYRILASDVIWVDCKCFYPYKIVKGIKHISKIYGRAHNEKYMIVDEHVWKAIDIYQKNNGYGGLGLRDYLFRVFPVDGIDKTERVPINPA